MYKVGQIYRDKPRAGLSNLNSYIVTHLRSDGISAQGQKVGSLQAVYLAESSLQYIDLIGGPDFDEEPLDDNFEVEF